MARRLEIAGECSIRPRSSFSMNRRRPRSPDPGSFWEDIQRLREEEGVTIFLTTHYMDEASMPNVSPSSTRRIIALDNPTSSRPRSEPTPWPSRRPTTRPHWLHSNEPLQGRAHRGALTASCRQEAAVGHRCCRRRARADPSGPTAPPSTTCLHFTGREIREHTAKPSHDGPGPRRRRS